MAQHHRLDPDNQKCVQVTSGSEFVKLECFDTAEEARAVLARLEKRDAVKLGEITKLDEAHQQVFGYFSVSVEEGGKLLEDSQEDMIEPEVLEQAAYDFVVKSRRGGVMHSGPAVATLIESFAITPEKLDAMGLAKDAIPAGWWGGFQIHDDSVWKQIEDRTLRMFSIQGSAERTEV